MYYYVDITRDAQGKRKVLCYYMAQENLRTGFIKSMFAPNNGIWRCITTENIYRGYMAYLIGKQQLLGGMHRDIRGIRYQNEGPVYDYETGEWDIERCYYLNRHQRKHKDAIR